MIGNSQENNLFCAKTFECVGLLENEDDDRGTKYAKYYLENTFKTFISNLRLNRILNLSSLYDFNVASYTCNLTASTPESSDLEDFDINNHAHIRITLKPAGINITFTINNQSYDKDRLINNAITLWYPDDQESLFNLNYPESFISKKNLSSTQKNLKKLVNYSLYLSDLLGNLTDKASFNNKGIKIFHKIGKTKILESSNNRITAQFIRIFLEFLPLLILASLDDPIPAINKYLSYRDDHFFYSLEKCSNGIGIDETELQRWVNNINRKGQIILQGPPGTGKTFIAKKLAEHFTRGKDGFSEIIQFHPSYSYEDFIQGIRPQTENGQLTYDLVPGRFLEFCKKAESYDDICVLIIDEINRANLSNVFGELMYLLEYRDQEINLAGSNEPFKIPENVKIIGTMNTADRSIALVDHALRRRFAFIKIAPNYNILKRYHKDNEINFSIDQLIQVLQDINKMINDPNYEIGISFFMIWKIEDSLQDIWEMEIEPYLEEYFYNALDKIEQFRWNKVKIKLGLNADENN
jgi:GTPase subunit of restriction endonuclease